MRARPVPPAIERGMSLVELMISLIVLAVGILAVGRMFPTGARATAQDRLLVGANYYAQEQIEMVTGRNWADPMLTDGRHPAGTAMDTLQNGRWLRFYQVTTMPGTLNNLKKVDVTVSYQGAESGPRAVTATTYVRR